MTDVSSKYMSPPEHNHGHMVCQWAKDVAEELIWSNQQLLQRLCIASLPSHSLCSHQHPQEMFSTSECATELYTSPHSVTLCCTALFHISPDASDCAAPCCALKFVQKSHFRGVGTSKKRGNREDLFQVSGETSVRMPLGWVDVFVRNSKQ